VLFTKAHSYLAKHVSFNVSYITLSLLSLSLSVDKGAEEVSKKAPVL